MIHSEINKDKALFMLIIGSLLNMVIWDASEIGLKMHVLIFVAPKT